MTTSPSYTHLGAFSDLVDEAARRRNLFPKARPGLETQRLVRETLGFCDGPETPLALRVENTWTRDGLDGEELSWSVGYGPRTRAYLLKPAGSTGPLPAVLALHDHGGFKYFGKEKIADGPDEPPAVLREYRRGYYGDRAWANALAREGFLVLVHDTFLWGSRRFPVDAIPERIVNLARVSTGLADMGASSREDEIRFYNEVSTFHEHLVAKYLNLLGTSQAGLVSYEDRVALNVLLARPEADPRGAGCMGLSGGGNRAALLQATHPRVRAAVIVGMMSTYPGLLDSNVYAHTWMFYPFGWSQHGDWPDLAACRAPSPLLVQYDLDDELFTRDGMRAAHERLAELYAGAGAPEAYTGQFFPGPHKFDLEMQAAAFVWLREVMRRGE